MSRINQIKCNNDSCRKIVDISEAVEWYTISVSVTSKVRRQYDFCSWACFADWARERDE